MARVGIDAASLEAVVVTHEHGDHVRGVDRLARKHRLPVYATSGTLDNISNLSDAAFKRAAR